MASTADRVELGKIRIDPDDADLLKRLSDATGATVAELRRRAYSEYVKRHRQFISDHEQNDLA